MTEDLDDETAAATPPGPRGRSIGLASAAVIIAIVALALVVWSVWRLQRATHAEQASRRQNAAAIASLENRLTAQEEQARAGSQHLSALESDLDDLRSTAQGMTRRIANLETAYTNLSGQQQSGHDTLLLNDVEMLLRTGQQRYELFHDSAGALKAYSQAIAVLAQVQNPAYTPVRASAATERGALAAAAPPSRQSALDTLSSLRGEARSLPLAAAESSAPTPGKPDFWSRITHSFSGIVRITREHGNAVPLADARFARQMLALNLAQAQEALLAFDETGYRAALQRADTTLAAQFAASDAGVKKAHAQLANLLAQRASGPAPRLGGALAQLQSLRANPPSAPVPSASSGAGP